MPAMPRFRKRGIRQDGQPKSSPVLARLKHVHDNPGGLLVAISIGESLEKTSTSETHPAGVELR